MLMVVQFRVASPRGGHAASRDVRSIVNKAEEFVFVHSLTKLPQYVIVYVSCVATGVEKGAGVVEPNGAVVTRQQVRAHRQEDCECVAIWVHF